MSVRKPGWVERKWWRQPTFAERYDTAAIYGTELDVELVLIEHDIELFFHENFITCNHCGHGHDADDSCYHCGRSVHPG